MKDYNKLDVENNFDIAIIGMSGRFPGANSVGEFWQNLCSGVESISFFSDEELQESGIDPAVLNNPNYVKAAPILDGPELFDASFFGFSPKEARHMDPQHRLFLECAWEALEHAGYDADTYEGPIGVYGGASINSYLLFSDFAPDFFTREYLSILIGNSQDYLTTRVSYKLNLKGPSITLQTACSTSLVAVHTACQSLLNRECDMALAGGVSVRVPHKAGHWHQEGSILSPDGHCRAFDAKARGTVFGSGVGIVLLKRLADAIADRDYIHAIIIGSAINNDGSSKVAFTAPSVDAQSEAVVQALVNSGIEADTIGYIEAHGTGTALGDPVEVAALSTAFRAYTDRKGFCAIGSVKTNIGHLDAAAGVASLIKTILALRHKMIPASLHFEKANPQIDFENSPFYVNSSLCEWKSHPYPRRAGVGSLGVGGTNAHIILEEAPVVEASGESRPWQLLLLSAKTNDALDTMTANLVEHLRQHPHLNLADVAYTLQVGRKVFSHRRMAVYHNLDDAVATLQTLEPQQVVTAFQEPINRDVVFMFSGQGSQYVNMGLELYKTESEYREQVDRCSEILKSYLDFDLRDVLYTDEKDKEELGQKLKQTFIAQPALFVTEYALAKMWIAWGIHPTALVGHSIGEYVAACLAGVFSLEDALSLVATRGRLMQELPGGSMLAVFLSEREVEPFLDDTLSLAVINGPSLCVVSGEHEAIDNLETQLSIKNVNCRRLHTSHAFHSKMMIPMIEIFTEQVRQVGLSSPQIPFVSNVTGTWITPGEATSPSYWANHVCQTVRFSDCIQELLEETNRVLLEVGPGRTLCTLVKQHLDKSKGQVTLSSIRHPKEEESDVAFILNTIGRLWLAGVQVDWSEFYADERRCRVPLPTYPFEREPYWAEPAKQAHFTASIRHISSEESEGPSLARRSHQMLRIENAYDGAPRDEIERLVAGIWQGLLGVERVSVYDDFFDLGGHSLLAVRLFAEIEEATHKKLPLSTLFQAPTVEKLADVLRREDWSDLWTSLVPVQAGGSRPPFFCVHGHTGQVVFCRRLVRYMGSDQPFYAFQRQGLDGQHPFHTRVEEMATHYVSEMRTLQPDGPYFLGGFCLGGTVAFEMAQQLHRQGEKVAFLALLDAANDVRPSNGSLVQKLRPHLLNLMRLGLREKMIYVMLKGGSVVKTAKDRLKDRRRDFAAGGIAQVEPPPIVQDYIPRIYPGRITLFRGGDQIAQFYRDPYLGWDGLAGGGVEVHHIPVKRGYVVDEPYVRETVAKLQSCIEETLVACSAEATPDGTSGRATQVANATGVV